jgi:hypothetical protein
MVSDSSEESFDSDGSENSFGSDGSEERVDSESQRPDSSESLTGPRLLGELGGRADPPSGRTRRAAPFTAPVLAAGARRGAARERRWRAPPRSGCRGSGWAGPRRALGLSPAGPTRGCEGPGPAERPPGLSGGESGRWCCFGRARR